MLEPIISDIERHVFEYFFILKCLNIVRSQINRNLYNFINSMSLRNKKLTALQSITHSLENSIEKATRAHNYRS